MAAPTSASDAQSASGGAAEEEAGGNKTVVITAAGDQKIAVIKAIRAIDQNLGLKEAKDMTENLPAEVLKDAKPEEAKEAADKLKEAGATVELK
jgi:large subunit ribosomal protein L7/L12